MKVLKKSAGEVNGPRAERILIKTQKAKEL